MHIFAFASRVSKKPTIPKGLAKKIDTISFPAPVEFFQTPSQNPPPLNYYHLNVPNDISRVLHADALQDWGINGKDVKVVINDTGFYIFR